MYLDKNSIARKKGSNKAGTIVWSILTAFNVFGIDAGFNPVSGDGPDVGRIVFFAICFVITGFLLVKNILDKKKLANSEVFDNVFRNDSDGVMTFSEISNSTRIPVAKVEKNILWLMKKNILVNCRFDDQSRDRIILTDVNAASTMQFAVLRCRNCGTTVQVRPGQVANCPSCGNLIQ